MSNAEKETAAKVSGHFRLYDFDTRSFVGPLESRKAAERRKTGHTKRRRDALANWYRCRVHPVMVDANGKITASYQATVDEWRRRLAT